MPDGEGGQAARAILEVEMGAENGEFETIAAAALAQIAVASRDVELGKRSAAVVRSSFDVLDAVLGMPMLEEGVVEAMVALSRWPEMEIDAERIRSYLERVECKYASQRRWRAEQLALLRR